MVEEVILALGVVFYAYVEMEAKDQFGLSRFSQLSPCCFTRFNLLLQI